MNCRAVDQIFYVEANTLIKLSQTSNIGCINPSVQSEVLRLPEILVGAGKMLLELIIAPTRK